MLNERYRVCPKCQHENGIDANFCLNCGNQLSTDDEELRLPNAGDQHFSHPAVQLDAAEQAAVDQLVVTTGTIPNGFTRGGAVFATGNNQGVRGYKGAWEDLNVNLWRLCVGHHYAGVANLKIVPTVRGDYVELFGYADGLNRN
ncbi:zinc ribbon domain-containing protein [Lactiplantibacillus garii]|uniref:Zinc ribbon domain-containing protein n=1 Tax=Lactiplantibacillus garii TaxID=2306423 RepID=A0A426DB48_9LACO|nr:zinc ribbon domain-containing protein [Lactiplantibacillus garii]RRK11753.1 zinc ribbon domain-containing protein [Lactiplantibacillus garii]